MRKVELLSPCGDMDCLKAAVNYGADAVYLGGTSFSARASANNFNLGELKEAVKYCHLRSVKVYMTINTLLSEKELENALKLAKEVYMIGVDALIIQDLGLFYRLREELPDFPLHASTQMHVHNLNGVKVCKQLGYKKIVVARESNLDFIKEACKQGVEIECFVHGAICVSYSGQCLMSAVSKNRSANKGMCAQCCRLKYKLKDYNGKEVKTDADYLLSPKDMFLLNDIPSLIEAGVSSFKIEGRLKSPAYVGLVTKIYRKAIDAYYSNEEYHISKKDYDDLLCVFNRGFTNAYLNDLDIDIFGNNRPNHMGKEIGKVIEYKDGYCLIRLNSDVNQFDGIRIINKYKDTGKILNTLTVNKKFVSKAYKNEIIKVKVDDVVYKGAKVVKTLDHLLEEGILNYPLKKRKVDLNITFLEDKDIFIKAILDDFIYEKKLDIKPEKALKAPISYETLKEQFSKFNDLPFVLDKFDVELGNCFMAKSQINEIRRNFYEEFSLAYLNSFNRTINSRLLLNDIDNTTYDETLTIKNINPVINNDCLYQNNVISEVGGLLNSGDKIAYYTLNVSNSYAYELLNRLGFKKIMLSSELTDNMIYDLIESYKQRNGVTIRPYVLISGHRTLMYIKRNPFIKYINNDNYLLGDGLNEYRLSFKDDHIEIIEKELFENDTIDKNQINPVIID